MSATPAYLPEHYRQLGHSGHSRVADSQICAAILNGRFPKRWTHTPDPEATPDKPESGVENTVSLSRSRADLLGCCARVQREAVRITYNDGYYQFSWWPGGSERLSWAELVLN